MKGPRINTVEDLAHVAKQRRSVVRGCDPHSPMPAAVMLNMQGRVILQVIKGGLFVYERAERRKWPQPNEDKPNDALPKAYAFRWKRGRK